MRFRVPLRSIAVLCMLAPWGGGFCPAAFAEMPDAGAIAGGFFTTDPMLPAGPGLSGLLGVAPPARPVVSGPDLCGPAIAGASASFALPTGLLNAIATVESGRPAATPQGGTVKPWPWTIDANGTGYFYPSKQAAEQAAAGFEAAGVSSLDIGCLQVNLAQHPDAFATLAQAFDPVANAHYAATFLTGLERKFGNWPQAVAAYHSQTPALGGPYETRVYAQWQNTDPAVALAASGMAVTPAAMPVPAFPLPAMTAGFAATPLQLSPLPPMRMMARSGGAAGRSLASYRAAPVAIAARLAPG